MGKSDFLEISIISAEDLRIDNRPIQRNAYVCVQTDEQNSRSTTLDRKGGSYPSWNETLQLPLPPSAQAIMVKVHYKVGTRTETVGMMKIQMSDVFSDYVPAHLMHFMSYRLRDREGRRNGIINLKFRMVGPSYMAHSINMSLPQPLPVRESSKVAIGIPVSPVCGM